MKNTMKFLGIIPFLAIIMFTMAACNNDTILIHICTFDDWAEKSAATCTTAEVNERSCSCGKTETLDYGKPLGHNWDYSEGSILPTCEEDGHGSRECLRVGCGEKDNDTDFNAFGHDWSEWDVSEAPNCIFAGVKVRDCMNCQKEETDDVGIDENGHDIEVVDGEAPTCLKDGYGTIRCKRDTCDYSETGEILEKRGHHFIEHWAEIDAATCIAAGLEERFCTHECDEAGDREEREIPRDNTAHKWSGWTMKTAATCIALEIQEKVCEYEHTHREEQYHGAINPVAHNFTLWQETTAPTCTAAAINTEKCSLCSAIGSKTQTGRNAIGHDYKWKLNTITNLTAAIGTTGICSHNETHISTDTITLSEYIATQAEPVALTFSIDLGNMTTAGSGWRNLLDVIEETGKLVDLDLSACTMTGTEFNPDYNIVTGKNKIVSIALPDTATSIASSDWNNPTFKNFNVLKLFSGEGLTSIGDYAFEGCTNLALTSLPEGLTSIGYNAFSGCTNLALTSLPEGLTSIGSTAFFNCTNLALISLPEGLTSIRNQAFLSCTSLALTSLPEGITSIEESAFRNCTNLALTSLPEGITSIGQSAFSSCTNLALTSLPEGLTSIGDYAFYGCTNLALTSLPEGLTSIGSAAFYRCTELALVTCLAVTPPTLGTSVFNATHENLRIEVPAGSVEAYKAATNWSTYADRIFAITP